MSIITKLKDLVISGDFLSADDLANLETAPLAPLCKAANEIRIHFMGNKFDLCSIINGRSGKCSEDCKYCAQSAHHNAVIEEYDLLDKNILLQAASNNFDLGIKRFSVVTSGKKLSPEEIDQLCLSYRYLQSSCGISLCASHGLLEKEDFVRLKEAGVMRYHNNLETSRRFFTEICSTHSYDSKLYAIGKAKEAGLEICSGGIIGLGENFEDRVNMALELRRIGIVSVPINIFTPIKGTPFENIKLLDYDDILRTVAVFRFILPDIFIRIAGGRSIIKDKGAALFQSGANGAITGHMLTTNGVSVSDDINCLKALGYEI